MTEKKKNDVLVIVDNAINSKRIPELTAQEYDLLFSLLGMLKEKGDRTINVDTKTLRDTTNKNDWSPSKTSSIVDSLWRKISSIQYTVFNEDGKPSGGAVLFSSLYFDKGKITVGINSDLVYMTNNFDKGNYLSFPVKSFVDIKGKHGKALYKMLVQWKSKGSMKYTPEQLYSMMEFPESYLDDKKKIKTKVINPAIKGIGAAIPGLKVEVEHHGRNVSAYLFSWDANEFMKVSRLAEGKPPVSKTRKDVTPKKRKSNKPQSFTPAGIPLEDQPTEEEIAAFLKERY